MTDALPANFKVSLQDLISAVTYNPEEGTFMWKYRKEQRPQWNGRCAGKPCGHQRKKDKYLIITINSKRTYGHLVGWILSGRTIPSGYFVDHVDGDTTNNRLNNLRLATFKESSYNTKSMGGTSKYKGVYLSSRNTFVAQVTVDRINIQLGSYESENTAAGVYNWVAGRIQGGFCKLNDVAEIKPSVNILLKVKRYTGIELED